MSAQIIPFVEPMTVDRAWAIYSAHVSQMIADPQLLADREWMEQRARLDARWQALYAKSGELEQCQ